jgi:hypothetical protein
VKFFTKQLWEKGQDLENFKKYNQEWQQVFDEYKSQLDTLRGRLSTAAFSFFSDADVHDGELLSLVITDGSRPAPLTEPVRTWKNLHNDPVGARLEVLDSYDKFIWRVSYEGLRRVLVDFPTDDPLFYRAGDGFGDWGYHELSDAGAGFLRHEVLFATGAVLLFEFKDVAVSCMSRQVARS